MARAARVLLGGSVVAGQRSAGVISMIFLGKGQVEPGVEVDLRLGGVGALAEGPGGVGEVISIRSA